MPTPRTNTQRSRQFSYVAATRPTGKPMGFFSQPSTRATEVEPAMDFDSLRNGPIVLGLAASNRLNEVMSTHAGPPPAPPVSLDGFPE